MPLNWGKVLKTNAEEEIKTDCNCRKKQATTNYIRIVISQGLWTYQYDVIFDSIGNFALKSSTVAFAEIKKWSQNSKYFSKTSKFLILFTIFAAISQSECLQLGQMKWDIYWKGVYYDALSLAYLNFATSDPSSGNKATVDVLLVCMVTPSLLEVSLYTYQRGPLKLLVLRWMAMRRPRYAERVTDRLPRVFVYGRH